MEVEKSNRLYIDIHIYISMYEYIYIYIYVFMYVYIHWTVSYLEQVMKMLRRKQPSLVSWRLFVSLSHQFCTTSTILCLRCHHKSMFELTSAIQLTNQHSWLGSWWLTNSYRHTGHPFSPQAARFPCPPPKQQLEGTEMCIPQRVLATVQCAVRVLRAGVHQARLRAAIQWFIQHHSPNRMTLH